MLAVRGMIVRILHQRQNCLRALFLGQHRTNEVVGWRMDFSSDANANFEGLLAVNREICMPQMAEKTSPDAPPNCAVVPWMNAEAASPSR